jgi:Xaa-Pro aminopeptidase
MTFYFSVGELARRRAATVALAENAGCFGVVAFGENRSGVAVTYLTEWPVTRGAILLLTSQICELWVSFHNHVPAASRKAQVDSVRDIAGGYLKEVFAPFSAGDSVATLGPIPIPVAQYAADNGFRLVPIDREHATERLIKSAEEIEALHKGAAASDIGALALIDACKPGASDWDLLAAAKGAYTAAGALDHICYISVTDMANPDRDVPSQFPEGRIVAKTSMVTFELSASAVSEYPGQILRSVLLGDPTDEVLALSAVAEECKALIKRKIAPGVSSTVLAEISDMIEQHGYTTTDDLFHGFGMGYLEPIATSRTRVPVHVPTLVLREGMAIVVQPNVTTQDHRIGVQTGELVMVDAKGARDLHTLPTGLVRL